MDYDADVKRAYEILFHDYSCNRVIHQIEESCGELENMVDQLSNGSDDKQLVEEEKLNLVR